jgi:hypothetical protein
MSQTISIGVVGPSHWAYMASVMAEKLARMGETRQADVAQIPVGVYRDAKRFFGLVLDAAGDHTPVNPPASVNAYALAADAVRATHADASRAEVAQTLEKQKALLDALQDTRALNHEDLQTLLSLQAFFVWVKQEGESEAYEGSVGHESSVALRAR